MRPPSTALHPDTHHSEAARAADGEDAAAEQRASSIALPPTDVPASSADTAGADRSADRSADTGTGGIAAMCAGFVPGGWVRWPRAQPRCGRAPVCRIAGAVRAKAGGGGPPRPEPGRDFYGIPNPGPGAKLRLSDLRERLIRQEETIIFALIERAQFKHNSVIYDADADEFELPGGARTFSEYLLFEIEAAYAKVRRYTSPDEHPFAPAHRLPAPILPHLDYPNTLCENDINVNAEIAFVYRTELLPRVCEHGTDQNYGSSAAADVACLQALSKRVHYGKFIAEAKIQELPDVYAELASRGDRHAIYERLSDVEVEERLLRRVANKARSYGRDITDHGPREVYKVEPDLIADMYKEFIIPLTKEVEIQYIMVRCAPGSDDGDSTAPAAQGGDDGNGDLGCNGAATAVPE